MSALSPTPLGMYDLLSGLALLALAFVVLRAGFSRRVNQLLFLYLFFRGGLATLLGLMRFSQNPLAAGFFAYSSVHFEIPLVAASLGLAATYPRATRWSRSGTFWLLLLATVVAFDAAYVLHHDWFLHGLLAPPLYEVYTRDNAWAIHALYTAILATQVVLVVRFAQAYLSPSSQTSRQQARYALAGVLALTAHQFGFWAGALPTFIQYGYLTSNPSAIAQSAVSVGGGFLGLTILARGLRTPDLKTGTRLPLVVFGAATVSGLLDGALVTFNLYSAYYWNASALWRIVGAGLLAYGILRFQLFDVDIRLKRLVGRGIQVGGSALVFGITSFSLLGVFGTEPAGIVVSQVAAGAAVLLMLPPLGLAGRQVADHAFPENLQAAEYVLERKLAVYRAALEGALEGTETVTPGDRELLTKLRRDLGITDREHAILEYAVRQGHQRLAPEAVGGDVSPGDVLLGKYRIERVLGEGSFGCTYLASAGAHAPPVALKRIRRDPAIGPQQKFLQEAKALAAIRHPNVVALLDVEKAGDDVFLAMEYVEGGSLEERLKEGGPIPLPEACAILRDVLLGLQAVHERGLVHRDVKPANILLSTGTRAKLADFGLASTADAPDGTLAGLAGVTGGAGTPAYMSPEQARGVGVDARTDLYAAAALFYEALTCRTYLAFSGLTEFEIRGAILTEPPRLPLDDQPEWVNALLRRGLEKDPGNRFQRADEMLEVLRHGAKRLLPPA